MVSSASTMRGRPTSALRPPERPLGALRKLAWRKSMISQDIRPPVSMARTTKEHLPPASSSGYCVLVDESLG